MTYCEEGEKVGEGGEAEIGRAREIAGGREEMTGGEGKEEIGWGGEAEIGRAGETEIRREEVG